MAAFPKLIYNLPTQSYGGALKFLKGLNPMLAKHQKREKGIPKPDADALKNTDDLYELIGRPLDIIPTIHVAGTNGKGSTSFKLAEGLKFSGLRTGLCTGPHISSFRERMQVNGELVTENDVVNLLEKVVALCAKHEISATFFEIAFIMTCLHFQNMRCDVVVLEVGMGGRYDASNVINSYLSVVTSIGMDHMNSLGGTLESIARHKAGIFKPGTAALVGPGCPLPVMVEEASLVGAELHTLYSYLRENDQTKELSSRYPGHPLLVFPSAQVVADDGVGTGICTDTDTKQDGASATVQDTQESSEVVFDTDRLCSQLALASMCLLRNYPSSCAMNESRQALFRNHIDIHDEHLLDLLLNSRLPCRFEEFYVTKELVKSKDDKELIDIVTPSSESSENVKVNVKVVLDVAHNTPALTALMKKLYMKFGSQMRVVMGMSRGKGTQECLDIVTQYVAADKIDFIQSDNHRAIAPEELYAAAGNSERYKKRVEAHAGVGTGVEGHVFNMIGGNTVASNYEATHNALHAVLEEIIRSGSTDASCGESDVCSEVLVVCGTLYAMAHVRRSLGIREPNDAFDVDVTI